MSVLRQVLGPDVKARLSDDEVTQLQRRLYAAENDRDRAQHLARHRLEVIEGLRAQLRDMDAKVARLRGEEGGDR